MVYTKEEYDRRQEKNLIHSLLKIKVKFRKK